MNILEHAELLSKILSYDDMKVRLTVLPHLGKVLNNFNRYFKYEVVGELWEMEKFSMKEAAHEFEVEK